MSDPVTSGGLFTEGPSDEELHTAAVRAVARVMSRKWAAEDAELMRAASDLLDLALDVGPRTAVVLVPDSPTDCYRLADAVLRTGSAYDGQPDEGDLAAAKQVIETLLAGSVQPA